MAAIHESYVPYAGRVRLRGDCARKGYASTAQPAPPTLGSLRLSQGEGAGTTAYDDIITLDSGLAAVPRIHYIDVRSLLVAACEPNNPQDVTDHANDIPPSSLRYDNIHFNAAAYAIVAKAVADRISAPGW